MQVGGLPGVQGGALQGPVPVPVLNQQALTQLVQSNNTPPPQLVQQQQGAQGNAPIGQLAPDPQTRGNDFAARKNQSPRWPTGTDFGRRVKDFFQKKFTSDGAFKLSTNTVSSGMAKGNVDAHAGDLTKMGGSATQQTGIDTGGEVLGIMNLAGEVLAYKALQEQDQGARGKIQTFETAKQLVESRLEDQDDAQTALTQATDERDDLVNNQLPQIQNDIQAKAQAVLQKQGQVTANQQQLNAAGQTLTNAQTALTQLQQVPVQNRTPQQTQQIQQLQLDVTNAQQNVQRLTTQDQTLQGELTTLTQEHQDLLNDEGNLNARVQTLTANAQTPGSILALTADLATKTTDLRTAEDSLKQLEATGALGKATKVEGTQKAYQIGQLTQKSGAVGAGIVKMTADSIGVVQGATTTFMSAAGVAATGVGALSLPLDCYSLHRDRLAIQGAKSAYKKVKAAEQNNLLPLDGTEKAFMKMMKRKLPIADKQFSAAYNSTKIIAGLGGATAVGFKIAVLAGCSAAAVTAGAACLTPIGWALAGVAAATLIGYGIFKLSRFIHSKRQQKAYLETVQSNTPLNTHKGQKILGKMADDYIALHPNTSPAMTADQYKNHVILGLSQTPNIADSVRERAEQGLLSRSRAYGVEIMTNRLRQEPKPNPSQNIPPGRTYQLLTALGVKPEDLDKIIDSNNLGDAQKLLGKRLRVT